MLRRSAGRRQQRWPPAKLQPPPSQIVDPARASTRPGGRRGAHCGWSRPPSAGSGPAGAVGNRRTGAREPQDCGMSRQSSGATSEAACSRRASSARQHHASWQTPTSPAASEISTLEDRLRVQAVRRMAAQDHRPRRAVHPEIRQHPRRRPRRPSGEPGATIRFSVRVRACPCPRAGGRGAVGRARGSPVRPAPLPRQRLRSGLSPALITASRFGRERRAARPPRAGPGCPPRRAPEPVRTSTPEGSGPRSSTPPPPRRRG